MSNNNLEKQAYDEEVELRKIPITPDNEDEIDRISKELDKNREKQIKESIGDQNETKNCLNPYLGTEYMKHGCDLLDNYKECKKNYGNGDCTIYDADGTLKSYKLSDSKCPSNFSCDNEVGLDGFACPGNVKPLDPNENNGFICPIKDVFDGQVNMENNEDDDEDNDSKRKKKKNKKSDNDDSYTSIGRFYRDNKYEYKSDNDEIEREDEESESWYDKINNGLVSRIWDNNDDIKKIGIEYKEDSFFSISNMTIYFVIIVIIIIIIISIILFLLTIGGKKSCDKEGMVKMLNQKILEQKQNIKNLSPNFFNKFVEKMN
jgi:hypothetical protein